jgi:hypothetical protein
VAAISGGVGVETCKAPVPARLEHGKADEVVPPALGLAARDLWVRTNGVDPDPVPSNTPQCVTFTGGEAPVVWCTHPEGHVLRPGSGAAAVAFLRGLAS